MKQRKLIAIFAALILLTAVFFSYSEFQVWNPLASVAGILGVCVFGQDYMQVQRFPHRVVIAHPSEHILEETMSQWGYIELSDERMGSMRVFQAPTGELAHVRVQMNGYFAKWIWH